MHLFVDRRFGAGPFCCHRLVIAFVAAICSLRVSFYCSWPFVGVHLCHSTAQSAKWVSEWASNEEQEKERKDVPKLLITMLKLIILFAFNLFEENNEDGKCMSGVESAGFCVFAVCMAANQGRNGGTHKKGEWNRKPGDTRTHRSLWFKKLLGILTHTSDRT